MLLNRLKRTFSFLLMITLLVCPLSACQRKTDPLAKSGFSSLTIGKKNRINAEITLDSRDLQTHAGQAIFLYELSPEEDLTALGSKEPLDSARVASNVTLSTDLTDGDRSRLYSRFFAVFSDGTMLSTDGFWIENPQVLATNQSEFLWSGSQKGISISDPNLAVGLGSMHMMLSTSISKLTSNATESFVFNGATYPISPDALTELDKQVLDAMQAGMQVSLTLTPDTSSRGQAVALIDLLTTRYSTADHGTITALFLDTDASASIRDVELLCRTTNQAIRSRIANARVYVVSHFDTVTETKTFFSNLRLRLSLGGNINWGAAVRPVLSGQPWKKDTTDLMTAQRLGELSQFLFFENNDTPATWFAVCGISFLSENAEEQAVAFAYTYREAITAMATLIYYDATDVNANLFDEDGKERRIASVFSNIDTALSQEDELLCQKTVGNSWTKTIAGLESRKKLTGIVSIGSAGFEEKSLFEFHDNELHGFTAINGTTPRILNSTAWNAPVLSTWIDAKATAAGGFRTELKDGSALDGVISLSTWLLTAQAGDASHCTVRLILEGEAKNKQRLTYSADIEVAHGEWQLITFQIADFVTEADLSRPIYVSLTTTPNTMPEEDYVFYVKDLYVRTPQTGCGTLLPTLSIVACVAVSTIVILLIYRRSSRKRI